jgi:hypothetical protein
MKNVSELINKYKILIIATVATILVSCVVWGCSNTPSNTQIDTGIDYTTTQDREMCERQPDLASCEDFK